MNTKIALLVVVAALLLATLLLAAPARAQSPSLLPVQGYLSDADGVPINGTRDLALALYDAPSGGHALHSETFSAEPITDGNFVVYLGGASSIDLALFRYEPELWLEVTVDAEVIEPRLQLATAPYAAYAAHCGDADTLGGASPGDFAAQSHQHAFADLTGVPPDVADGDDDTLAALGVSCAAGQLPRWNGAAFECGPVAFDAIDWPAGFAFLTIEPCPAGFIAVESGYLKLSDTPDLVLSARSLATPGHSHSRGTLTVQSAGDHTHDFSDSHYLDSGLDPSYATGSGDDVGQLVVTGHTTAVAGAHTHALGGAVGATGSGHDGDGDLPATGDLEHVSLRLCIKN